MRVETNTMQTEPQKLFCEKCGGKIPEGAKFCPACAAPVDAQPRKKSGKIIAVCVAAAAVICIAAGAGFYMHSKPAAAGNKTAAVKQEEKQVLSEDEILRKEYFHPEEFIMTWSATKAYLRNPAMFADVCIGFGGNVSKVFPTDDGSKYSMLCTTGDDFFMLLEGTYAGDVRYLEGDEIRLKGFYGGTRNVDVDGRALTVGVLTGCTEIKEYFNENGEGGYSLDEVRRIMRSIFGSDIDVQSDTGAEGYSSYKFSIPNPNGGYSQWSCDSSGGYTRVSTDGGVTSQVAIFTDDYKNYFIWDVRSADKLAVLKYCDLKGTVLWTKEFPLKSTESYAPDPFIMNGNIYVFCNEEIQIIKPADGSVIKTAIFTGNYSLLAHEKDMIIFYDYQYSAAGEAESATIVAADADGNVLWKGEGNGFPNDYYIKEKDGAKTVIIRFNSEKVKAFA